MLDEPRRRNFHAIAFGEFWNGFTRAFRERGVRGFVHRRVHEKRSCALRVGIARIEDHPLASSKREHRFTNARERRGIACLYAERTRERRITIRRAVGARAKLERNAQDDPAARALFEHAVSIRETACVARQRDHVRALSIPHAHVKERLFHFLSVRADVLHRRRADQTGNARHALGSRKSATDHPRDEVVPRLARRDVDLAVVDHDAARGDAYDGAVETFIREDDVAAAAEDEDALAARIAVANRFDQHALARSFDEPSRLAAEPERRVLRESHRNGFRTRSALSPCFWPILRSFTSSRNLRHFLARENAQTRRSPT